MNAKKYELLRETKERLKKMKICQEIKFDQL